MPDGSNRQGTSWETSPMDIAKEVSKSLSERVVIAKASRCMRVSRSPIDTSSRSTASSGTSSARWKSLAR
jgi:threonyl-tRNA synthetase